MKRIASLLIALLVALPVWAGADLRYGQVAPPQLGGPIELTDHMGQPFSLAKIARRPALLFFGFTQCGVTCPVALMTAKQLLAKQDVPVLFVTLDPLTDDPATLRLFVSRFDARLIGLTGQPEQVEQVVERYRVGSRRTNGILEHSSVWYLLDGQGRVARIYPFDTPAAHLQADLLTLQPRVAGVAR
jgi:protein SCO1